MLKASHGESYDMTSVQPVQRLEGHFKFLYYHAKICLGHHLLNLLTLFTKSCSNLPRVLVADVRKDVKLRSPEFKLSLPIDES